MSNILDKIVTKKREEVARYQAELPLARFRDSLTPSDRDFVAALKSAPTGFILECKKASPSKGLIREDFDPQAIAGVYRHWAAAISVLTDEPFFQGHYDFLAQVRAVAPQPVLCKDFVIDPYQIYRARHHGADAILLMLSVLDDDQYRHLAEVARSLNIDILTEVSNDAELERAIALDAPVIGINNRDLTTLTVDLETTRKLAPRIPADRITISESGIYTHQQVLALSPYVDAFLVGSSLMAEDSLEGACRGLILGHSKVCGLTRAEDVRAAYQAGAEYGGLIFFAQSPRAVTLEQARGLVQAAPLKFVGVFVNAEAKKVAEKARTLGLAAIQLHGQEDAAYVQLLRTLLPPGVEVWKAHRIAGQLPDFAAWPVDRHLLDTYRKGQAGGTGETFSWHLLDPVADKSRVILAGGLGPDNVAEAAGKGCYALDMNSGVESAPGIKDAALLEAAFSKLRDY